MICLGSSWTILREDRRRSKGEFAVLRDLPMRGKSLQTFHKEVGVEKRTCRLHKRIIPVRRIVPP